MGEADPGRERTGVTPVAGRVRRLDPRVVAKIAAGEMILRPFSVVKELVENSLDAGADGDHRDPGRDRRIRGCGSTTTAAAWTARISCSPSRRTPRASSSSEEDLLRVTTLGFRGEAIPSIGRVSRMEIVTCGGGGRRVGAGGRGRATRILEPAARARGTSVTVEDLFFNSPVRKRFLKGPESEVRLIVRLARGSRWRSPPSPSASCTGTMLCLHLPAARELAERMRQVHGPSFLDKLLPARALGPGRPDPAGTSASPSWPGPAPSTRSLLVNRRWVTAPWLSAALRQGFGDLLPPNRHPFALIVADIDPSRVDVNVHPTKREIRFLDESALFGAVVRAVRRRPQQPGARMEPRPATDPGSGTASSGAGWGQGTYAALGQSGGRARGSTVRPGPAGARRLLYARRSPGPAGGAGAALPVLREAPRTPARRGTKSPLARSRVTEPASVPHLAASPALPLRPDPAGVPRHRPARGARADPLRTGPRAPARDARRLAAAPLSPW